MCQIYWKSNVYTKFEGVRYKYKKFSILITWRLRTLITTYSNVTCGISNCGTSSSRYNWYSLCTFVWLTIIGQKFIVQVCSIQKMQFSIIKQNSKKHWMWFIFYFESSYFEECYFFVVAFFLQEKLLIKLYI